MPRPTQPKTILHKEEQSRIRRVKEDLEWLGKYLPSTSPINYCVYAIDQAVDNAKKQEKNNGKP